jgi:hypothetical protein
MPGGWGRRRAGGPRGAYSNFFGGTYYVLAGERVRPSGIDWANADGEIPGPLAAGDVAYVGNSRGKLVEVTRRAGFGPTRGSSQRVPRRGMPRQVACDRTIDVRVTS